MAKYFLYSILNLFFFLVTLYCLLYVSTYVNLSFVPDRFLWNGDNPRTDYVPGMINIIMVIFEAVLITALVYAINRLILYYDYNTIQAKSIAVKTALVTFGIILCIILYGIIYFFITK